MLILKGKYNEAKIFADTADEASVAQVRLLLDQEFTAGSKIRMMPDIHAGAGCTIGTTMTVTDRLVPNLVGVDIGCGMETVVLKEKHLELQKLDKLIYEKIPSGFQVRESTHPYFEQTALEELYCWKHIHKERAEKSLGTLGGGNHFIEVDQDEQGVNYLVIHSGSRHLGVEVAEYYQQEGYKALNGSTKKDIDKLIEEFKAQGRQKEIQKSIVERKQMVRTDVPKNLAYVSGELFDQYIHDMKIVQDYARLNRLAMLREIVKGMRLHLTDQFTTIHNYIDTETMILRKGAVSAKKGERLLIPVNMRDGSLICVGKGNADWNESAPHGAGRLMSRSAARQSFTVSEFKKQMSGIYSTSVNQETLDECPMAYKAMDDIVKHLSDTAAIEKVIRPIYNFKASGEETPLRKGRMKNCEGT
ncbi:MAG: RtcB family protein [Eubacterium sp.]|nr:RtcB family protein [Eubacterium sp.]